MRPRGAAGVRLRGDGRGEAPRGRPGWGPEGKAGVGPRGDGQGEALRGRPG